MAPGRPPSDEGHLTVAMIMAYHWIYRELLGLLETEGLAQPPVLAGQPGGQLAPTLYAVAARCVTSIR